MAMREMLTVCSLGVGVLSAVFWILSARAKVMAPPEYEGKGDGVYFGGMALSKGTDLVASLQAQSAWNGRAAYAAAATVVLQILASYWPMAV